VTKPLGYVLWSGKSWIDGKQVMCIATGFNGSSNRKTGNLIQTYILAKEANPVTAIKQNLDRSVCGDCVHRGSDGGKGRTCYVNIGQGPRSVYDAWERGRYLTEWDSEIFRDRIIRLGTYGDPAVVPLFIWDDVLRYSTGHTGYTHQWENPTIYGHARYCMASVDSEEEQARANALGWRTFRVTPNEYAPKTENEVLCPASELAGKKLTCSQCLACGGGDRRSNIYIPAHGPAPVMKYMRERHAITATTS
jgi:hypothetical protein